MWLRGSSSTSTSAASRCVLPSFALAAVRKPSASPPGATTKATGVSPQASLATPTTAASTTPGRVSSTASISEG